MKKRQPPTGNRKGRDSGLGMRDAGKSAKQALQTVIAGVRLPTPVLVASGIWGYGEEYAALEGLDGVGALVLKSITLQPRAGNAPSARTVETPAGMLNSIGLENVGLAAFLAEKLPAARRLGVTLLASIAGQSAEEFVELAQALDQAEGLAGLELNISCPNVKRGGIAFGVDPEAAAEVVRSVRAATRMPVIPKLTPNVTDITAVARACESAGADAISLINTFSAMAIDIHSRRPKLGEDFGGLSGPAIRPAAVLRTFQVARAIKLPVIGMGGIWDAQDALEFIIAGASAVAVGTTLYFDPGRPRRIVEGIRSYLQEQGIERLSELVGSVRLNRHHPEQPEATADK